MSQPRYNDIGSSFHEEVQIKAQIINTENEIQETFNPKKKLCNLD